LISASILCSAGRSIVPARQSTIVIGGLDQKQSFTGLAPDERFAGLALGMQRVELLVEAFL